MHATGATNIECEYCGITNSDCNGRHSKQIAIHVQEDEELASKLLRGTGSCIYTHIFTTNKSRMSTTTITIVVEDEKAEEPEKAEDGEDGKAEDVEDGEDKMAEDEKAENAEDGEDSTTRAFVGK